MYYISEYLCPIKKITIASDGKNLCGLWFNGQKYFADFLGEHYEKNNDLPILIQVKDWLDRYFAHQKPNINELPLKLTGSSFQKSVWKILCDIPYGKIETYGQIALKMNKSKMAARAIGSAISRNPVSIVVPCHRVIGYGGNLTGYAAGIDTKIKLLEHEDIDISKLKYYNDNGSWNN
ncbi:MAG: methylated-DNA--[protein]-cysteine S-methyltransferase [Candidatus Gastranaerophilales bacterium]|nr:methylated-DNA--[protein]-cysteine S-methyltransferase [Candidatus Gastranaerophilales bacterium]